MNSNRPPDVCVVVLNYKNKELTDRCLASLKSQSYRNFRIAVVENGSNDGSADYLTARHADILLIQNAANLGFAGGVNAALRMLAANPPSYVWLLNNDAIPDPDALAELVQTAESDTLVAAVGSIVHEPGNGDVWGGGRVSFRSGLPRHIHEPVAAEHIDYLTGASLLLNWKALEQAAFLDERYFLYWEDADLCYRLRELGWKLAVSEKSRVRHDRSSSAVFQSAFWDFHFTASSILFFRRHSQHPLLPIFISTAGRFTSRCLQGKWDHARAVWRAVRSQAISAEVGYEA